jgi:hypothetical protein
MAQPARSLVLPVLRVLPGLRIAIAEIFPR